MAHSEIEDQEEVLADTAGLLYVAPCRTLTSGAPLQWLALGLYSISCQLQRGLQPRIGYCLREGRRHLGNELVYSMILLVIFLFWVRAASVVHVFFPMEADPDIADLALLASALTALLAFAVLLQVLGYGSWYGYVATIQAEAACRSTGICPRTPTRARRGLHSRITGA